MHVHIFTCISIAGLNVIVTNGIAQIFDINYILILVMFDKGRRILSFKTKQAYHTRTFANKTK